MKFLIGVIATVLSSLWFLLTTILWASAVAFCIALLPIAILIEIIRGLHAKL